MPTLQYYFDYVDKFGPEMVVKTASMDPEITHKELVRLNTHIAYMNRVHNWVPTNSKKRTGGNWVTKSEVELDGHIRKCLQCGLDLPRSRNRKARFCDGACKQKWYREHTVKPRRKIKHAKK